MAKLSELYAALERAAQANDDESAREIASYIKAMQPPARIMPPEQTLVKEPEKASALRRVGDFGLSALQGAIALPESVVGLADIPTGGRVGKALEDVGYRPKEAKDILQSYKSAEQQEADKYVGEGEGFFDTVGRAIERPSTIAGTVVQSIPSMLGGAGIARGILKAAPKVGALAAGAIGEGAVSAGLSAEDIRQQSESGLITGKQAGLSTLSGVFTGVLGGFGGKVAQKYLNVGDIDTILAGGITNAEKKGLLTSIIKAGLSEAVLEELPQSGQEQVMRNLALDKPWDEGVAESMAMGVLAALPMGGAAGYSSYRAGERKAEAEEKQKQAALAKSSAERARQDRNLATIKAEAEQTQYADEERTADLAGKAAIDAEFAAKANAPRTKQSELDLYPETTVEEIAARRAAESEQRDLFIPESTIQEITKPKLDEDTITSFGFKKNSLAYKALEALNSPEISPKDKVERFEKIIENNQNKIKTTEQGEAVDKFRSLLTRRIPADPAALEKLRLEKLQQAEAAERKLINDNIKAREEKLKIFSNDPLKRDALTGSASARAFLDQQAKPQIPDEAFPVNDEMPELTPEEKAKQLERGLNEQEAANFQLEEQFQPDVIPTVNEEPVNETVQQAPAEQGNLFNQFGQPTAAALRGASNNTGLNQAKPKGTSERDAVPSTPEETNVGKTKTTKSGPLGNDIGASRRSESGTETSEETKPSTLEDRVLKRIDKLFDDGTISADEYLEYTKMLREKGPENTNTVISTVFNLPNALNKTVRSSKNNIDQQVQQDVAEAQASEAEGGDGMASRKTAPKDYVALVNEIGKHAYTPDKDSPFLSDRTFAGTVLDVMNSKEFINADTTDPKVAKELYDNLSGSLDANGYTNYIQQLEQQYSESRKAKSKNAPKDISGKLRPESTEPTTPELFAEKVSKWFNPVWYKNAIKNGMINIVDGDINDSDLSDAIKQKYANSKALFTPEGKAYFFIKNITKGNELGVFLHEIGEHKGLENLIGKDRVKQLANRVRDMAEGKGKVSAKEQAMAKQAIEMAEGQAQNDKEIIAYFGEIAVFNGVRPGAKAKPEFGKATGWITELWSSIKNAINKLHLDPNKVSDKDIVEMLYGAARLELGAESAVKPNETTRKEDAILASNKTQGSYALKPEERTELESQGYVVFDDLSRPSKYQELSELAGNPAKRQSKMDKLGNSIFGPLYSLTRKTAALYGGQIKNEGTNKLYGVYVAQHALNANNLSSQAALQGALEIGSQGEMYVVENEANYQKLADNWNTLISAMERDGISKPMAQQYGSLMAVADRYESLIKRGEKTRDEFPIQNTIRANELKARYAAEFNTWRDNYTNMRNGMRGVILKSGLMTPKKVDELLNRMEYIPFYRIKDAEALDGVFIKNLLSAKNEQKLVGGTENLMIGDVMTNIMKNQMWLYNRVIYNHTTNLIVDQVEEMGIGKHLPVRPSNAENVISYLRDGVIKHFQFDDVNDMELFKQQPVIETSALRMMKAFSGVLRKTITLTPSFMYRQTWNDALRAWMQSGTDKSFLSLLIQSAGEQVNNFTGKNPTELAKDLRMRGIIGAVEFQDSYENFIDNVLGREYKGRFKTLNNIVQTMERAAQNSDMAARAIVYDAAIKEGNTPAEAAVRAQMMLNYQHRGTNPALRALLTTIPFINTQLQSDWRLLDALKGNVPGLSKAKARQLLGMKVAKFALVTAAYAMLRSGDDDYEDATEENRNRNFLFDVGGVPLRIPVAPEYMVLKSSIEQATRLTMDNEFATNKKLGHAVLSGFGNLLLSPTDVMPSVIRPFLENITNYSFFQGRALVGIDQRRKLTNEQYVKGQTSEISKWLSNFGQEVLGDELNVSPIKIDNTLRGLFGTMGQDVMFVTNVIAESVNDRARPSLKLNQLPEVGTAFYDPQGGQREADYYDLKEKVDKRYDTYLDIRKTDPQRANQFRQDNIQYFRIRPQLESIEKQLTNLRARKNKMLESKTMSSEEKAEMRDKISADKKRILGTRIQKMLEGME